MTTFDRREEAFENQFAHEEEMHFKAEARRNKMLATWAAGLLHKESADADRYIAEFVNATVTGGGDAAIVSRLKTDLDAGGHSLTENEIRNRLDSTMAEAIHYVKTT